MAVCDAGGRLIAQNTMDGASMAAAFGERGEAMASAAFAKPSGELAGAASCTGRAHLPGCEPGFVGDFN